MISYGKQSIDKEDIEAVVSVLKSDYITQGPKVEEFEKKLAEHVGAKYAVAVTNGTSALHLAYLVAGISEGDEVITTPNTFVATTNMLLAVGARVVFCDIDPETYNIDTDRIESLVTEKTKAIVPVHFAGQPCDMDSIFQIAEKHNLIVIEDASHALGARYKNKKVGSMKSDMTTFSFHPVKPITTGEGGAVVTDNKEYYEKLKHLRSHGIKKDKKGFNVMTELGYNYRLTDIQATLGISQLKKLDKFIEKRRKLAKIYAENLKNLKEISLPTLYSSPLRKSSVASREGWSEGGNQRGGTESSWHIYVIRTIDEKIRDELAKFLKNKDIGVNFHYPAVYSHPYYQEHGYKGISLPETDEYHKTAITLPLHTLLTKDDLDYICDSVKEYFDQ